METLSLAQSFLSGVWIYFYLMLYSLSNVACAFYVYQDAIRQDSRALNISPYWWGALSLLGGIWTLLAYWLMQHSILVKPRG